MKPAPNISIPPARVVGDWAHLHEVAQVPRYRAIAELVERYAPKPTRLLDIGCGTGELSSVISKEVEYLGVELSTEAILHAVPSAKSRIVANCAENFVPAMPREAIVLSELCYYVKDPIAVLTKYAACLEPNGIMIVTIWQRPMGLVESLKHFFVPNTNKNAWATALVEQWMRQNGGALRDFDVEREGGTHWRVWCWRTPKLEVIGWQCAARRMGQEVLPLTFQ